MQPEAWTPFAGGMNGMFTNPLEHIKSENFPEHFSGRMSRE